MNQKELLQTSVSQVMTKDLITVKVDTSLHKVRDIFDQNNINHLPVLNTEGVLMGIISDKDLFLLLDWGTRFGLKGSEVRNKHLLDSNTAEDLMTKNIVSVSPSDNLGHCAEILRENKFHALPVIEQGKLVGIITSFDMLLKAYGQSLLSQ
jgi:CBS domain-containing protein